METVRRNPLRDMMFRSERSAVVDDALDLAEDEPENENENDASASSSSAMQPQQHQPRLAFSFVGADKKVY